MNCWNRVVQTIAASGKPVLYADFQYGGSGGFLVYTAGFLRQQGAERRLRRLVADRTTWSAAVQCFELVKKGGSVAEFVAATARVRKERTPAPGDLACKPDKLAALVAEGLPGRR